VNYNRQTFLHSIFHLLVKKLYLSFFVISLIMIVKPYLTNRNKLLSRAGFQIKLVKHLHIIFRKSIHTLRVKAHRGIEILIFFRSFDSEQRRSFVRCGMADLVYRRVMVAKKPVKDFVSVLIKSVIVIVTM
jgi:hypothetical protein